MINALPRIDSKGDVRLFVNGDYAGTASDVQIQKEYYMDHSDDINWKYWDTTASTNNTIAMQPKQSFTVRLSTNDIISTQNAMIDARNQYKDWYWDTQFTGNTTTKNIPQSVLNPNKQYVQPPAGFNKYVNASDLLEEFIGFLGDEQVRSSEVMDLPIELFIKWLVIRACEEDDEEPNVVLELPAPKPQPRCLGCQRFMRKGTEFPLHGRRCAAHLYSRTEGVQHVQTKGIRRPRIKVPALL